MLMPRAFSNLRPAWSIFLSLLLLVSAFSFDCTPRAIRNTDQTSAVTEYDYSSSILSGGLQRTYDVHISADYDKSKPTPLVIVLHGGDGNGQGMIKLTGFNAVADRENFIVVYPDGFEKHWNDGRAVQRYSAQAQNIDDVSFISALIDHLSDQYNIDANRVYATGISNGAFMSNRLGCQLSQKIAAIAPVAGNMPANIAPTCAPTRPISVLIINGTDDPLVPWTGGYAHLGSIKLGEILSVDNTVKLWVDNDKCPSSPTVAELPDKDPSDGTRVTTETYSGCADSTEVILFKVEGGGHTWPGGLQYLPEAIIGRTSRDFNASNVIWQFFSEHPMQ
jgi:polyhydroxybutyrate depolymerase